MTDVLILTQADCGFCHAAEEIFSRLATEYPLRITTLDINTPEGQAIAMRHGLLFPPGILINGDAFSYGRPSERKLRRTLERIRGAT
jgi:thiol-disulfide isomerase/thioredoxin